MTSIDPLARLNEFVKRYPTRAAAANALGISGPYLHDLMRGRRPVSVNLLDKLGLMRVEHVMEKGGNPHDLPC